MAFWKRNRRQKAGIISLFVQVLTWFTLAWMLLLSVTLAVTLRFSLLTLEDKIETNLTATATSLSDSGMVRNALRDGFCSEELTGYLDDLITDMPDLDVITIANTRSIRLYHVVSERIGLEFVGGDQKEALMGESYLSDNVGTMGLQRRAFSPVLDENDEILGFVMASTTMDRLSELHSSIIRTYVKMAAYLVLASLLLSGLISFLAYRMLHGLSPEDLIRTYLTQNEVLNNLEEGIISVDSQGGVQLVNQSAERMLGQQAELLEGVPLDELIRGENGSSLLDVTMENTFTSRPNILSHCIPLEKDGKRKGTTLILKDKTDTMRKAEQLNGTRHIITALRVNSHEFMNKLQVISGLLQMERPEDAMDYIGTISAVHAKVIGPVLQHIHNPNVAALLLGKLGNMRELDIQPTLLANSRLPEHSQYLSTQDMVTTIGNLLENSIEAVNARDGGEPRSITFQITEDNNGLIIMVSDTGIGIEPRLLEHIYNPGFSTKAVEGRGVGMSLVRDILTRHKGSIEVDSEPGSGTTFTLIFGEKRKGR